MELNTDTFNRLSLGIIEKDKCSPEEAINKLQSLQLNLICTDIINTSLPLQAALLTAINTGKRAFLGGVYIKMPNEVKCLLPWPGKEYLNDIAVELGATISNEINNKNFCLTFGLPGSIDDNCMQVVCNDWQAGILTNGESMVFEQTGTVPTAGVFAGGLAVFLAFLKMSGINIAACDNSNGISLWRPDLHWLDSNAKGPQVEFLPEKYWILGLGHLGQAYLWNIGLLPYNQSQAVTILLQDDDKIVDANWSAGLLSEIKHRNLYKTRLCGSWLEARGFETIITERRFDANTQRINQEPFVALCGFDSASSRLPLENAGFDLIVETGLGSSLSTFDIIALHTFPDASKTPNDLWGIEDETKTDINEVVYDILKNLHDDECGIVPLTISGKSLSASFVGACSGALVIAELLRGLHGGIRYDKIAIQLRDISNLTAIIHKDKVYSHHHARNGFIEKKTSA